MKAIFNIETPLKKNDVELHVLNESHKQELENLASDSRLWKYAPHPYHEPTVFKEKWLSKTKERVCFVIFYKNKMIGSSSYYDIDLNNKKLTIGYTWLHPDYWGTKINRQIKLIMLDYAFNTLECIRVEFAVDSLNTPSQNALGKLGIKQEGLLRNHMLLSNGRIRHTYIYSVIPEEWPGIRRNIENLI
ncbi:MAG TPA: GNAT family protein [Gammaproteobacteria bacterium]|nr:GNAT family protein [Gammaproteobacteria bacterium]